MSAHALDSRVTGVLIGVPVVAAGHGKADAQTFDIPLPGSGQGFVEIVEVEDQIALGSRKQTEIQEMTIPTGLYPETGGRGVARSQAMSPAEPRRKVNGLRSMRP